MISRLQTIIIKVVGLTTLFHLNQTQPQKRYFITPLVNHVEYKIGKLGGTFCHFISARIPEQKEFDILKLFSTKHSYFLRIQNVFMLNLYVQNYGRISETVSSYVTLLEGMSNLTLLFSPSFVCSLPTFLITQFKEKERNLSSKVHL